MARSSDQTNGQNSGGIPPLRGRISRSSRSAPHPGAFLESRFLEPLGISQAELAQAIGVSRRRINELIVGKRSISTDTAIRLSRYFRTEPEFWLSLQMRWDIHQALENENNAETNRFDLPEEKTKMNTKKPFLGGN